ncbi:MAG TPA: hypothetical protein HA232_03440 [Methanocellales archaeon]|nr:hypothetical protein [Methanocellales archaeon]
MKVLLLPIKGGTNWWVVTHSFSFKEAPFKNVRPIHVLTFVAQELAKENKKETFHLSLSLENKIFAVRHNLSHLRSSVAKTGDPVYDGQFEKEYDTIQEIIADLEAYLFSIYSVLEITARLNRSFSPELPQSFRRQAKKYELFDFKDREWLGIFYDLRAELTHYGTPLPLLKEGGILIDFQNTSKLEHFKKGEHRILFEQIFNFYPDLMRLLDQWADKKLTEITEIDKEKEHDIWGFADYNMDIF